MSMRVPLPAVPESTVQFARKVLIELHQTIIAHDQGALAGEVEAIHDMRVAIRRLRVTLSNFAVCLTPADRERLRTRLKRLADALGAVRDLDVMISTIKLARAAQSPGDRRALDSFIRRLQGRRRRRHRNLVSYLQSEEHANFRREFAPVEKEDAVQNTEISNQDQHGQAA